MFDPMPTLPEQRGEFLKIPPAQFRAVARKAQGFTDAESAAEVPVSTKTVSSYIESARQRLKTGTTQDLIWLYFIEYVPELLYPDGVPDVVYGTIPEGSL